MLPNKLLFTFSVLLLLSSRSGATAIATSKISMDLSSAAITFDFFDGVQSAVQSGEQFGALDVNAGNYAGETNPVLFSGEGTISTQLPGLPTSATAESYGSSIASTAIATTSDGGVWAQSNSTAFLGYEVENLKSVTFTLDVTASIELQTENMYDFAAVSLQEFIDLDIVSTDGLVKVGADYYENYDYFVLDGDKVPRFDDMHTLSITYSFDNAFNGQLFFQGTVITVADAYTESPLSAVPEPSSGILIFMGIGMLGLQVRKYRR